MTCYSLGKSILSKILFYLEGSRGFTPFCEQGTIPFCLLVHCSLLGRGEYVLSMLGEEVGGVWVHGMVPSCYL